MFFLRIEPFKWFQTQLLFTRAYSRQCSNFFRVCPAWNQDRTFLKLDQSRIPKPASVHWRCSFIWPKLLSLYSESKKINRYSTFKNCTTHHCFPICHLLIFKWCSWNKSHSIISLSIQVFRFIMAMMMINWWQFQIMADVNFLSDIFSVCKSAVEDENHILHVPFQVSILLNSK